MLRIRRIHDDTLVNEPRLLSELQALYQASFPEMSAPDLDKFLQAIRRPWRGGFRFFLFASEQSTSLTGLAMCSHHQDPDFLYLDYIAAGQVNRRGGLGEALYHRVREKAVSLGALGLFLECNAVNGLAKVDPAVRKMDRARIRFYERLGARQVDCPEFEAPRSDGSCWTLFFDDLGRGPLLKRDTARRVLDVILAEKNPSLASKTYRERVQKGLRTHPIPLREVPDDLPPAAPPTLLVPQDERILIVQSDGHEIHHVRDRGYCEVPIRIREILRGLSTLDAFTDGTIKKFSDSHITEVHDRPFFSFLKQLSTKMSPHQSVYAEVFALRQDVRPPQDLIWRIGYYAQDSFTPVNANAFHAARQAVNCTLTTAQALAGGQRLAYSLVRPPGHHAQRDTFGGFCYLNSAAIAAHYLSKIGRVAILDTDFHHGNGQQDIFYQRDDVLTVSIHADPHREYPYYWGFADEVGRGAGEGFNLNLPLPVNASVERYMKALTKATSRIAAFDPRFLVVAHGFDTAKRDPTGSWQLVAKDFRAMGHAIGGLDVPTLIVQEGGYRARTLGTNARSFFQGLWEAARQ